MSLSSLVTSHLLLCEKVFDAYFKILHLHSLKVREHHEKPNRTANNAQDLNNVSMEFE